MKRRKFINITALGTMGLGFEAFTLHGKTHILTLSFDDGFRKSFYRIAEIHEEYGLKACLNVIASGHLKSFNTEPNWIPQHLLGDFEDWNLLKNRGHEIMPHTWEHRNLTENPIDQAKRNIDKCLDFFEANLEGYKAGDSVYNFAYNASTLALDDHALLRVRAVRTGGWLVLNNTLINTISADSQPTRLGCWGHGPDYCDSYVEETVDNFLDSPGGWLILNLHGLDEEGWGPIRSGYLNGLLKRLIKIDHLEVSPTGRVLQKFKG